jgi:hypothetical protein
VFLIAPTFYRIVRSVCLAYAYDELPTLSRLFWLWGDTTLRHQIGVLRRSAKKRPKLTVVDRVFWACLSRAWANWRAALIIVKPETVRDRDRIFGDDFPRQVRDMGIEQVLLCAALAGAASLHRARDRHYSPPVY